jgi:ABC-type transport system involved in cytochrome bd biosynthesis fused ATPase/permease subunit
LGDTEFGVRFVGAVLLVPMAALVFAIARTLTGSVRLGGTDVREVRQDDLRRAVRLVAQDDALFTTTLAENVRLARPEATDADVGAALAAAGLQPWIAELPEGLATMIGENGATVSGGQRRRIALARALLADARFLVVDEPTAQLDPDGAAETLRRLVAHAREREQGLLAIVHGSASLDAFDRVVELRDGRVS